MKLEKFKKSRTKRKGYLVKSCNTKIRKEALPRIYLPFFASQKTAITMQREKQSKALLSPVVNVAFFAHELVYTNSCAKERYSCRTLRREGVHVRRFSDPSLFPHPGGDQDRQPVFLRLSVQEGTDEGVIRLKPKTGSQRDPHPAAQGLQGARSNLCLPPSCAGE